MSSFRITLPFSSAVVTWFPWIKSRNNICNCLLCQSSTNFQSNSPEMYQSFPKKTFLLAVALSYNSSSWPHVIFPWTLYIHHKLEARLLILHRERYKWYATTFLQDVSIYGPHLFTFSLICLTIYSPLPDWYVPLVFLGHIVLPSNIISLHHYFLFLRLVSC